MPKNKFQHFIYAAITIFITVNCFVLYCTAIEHGGLTLDLMKSGYSLSAWVLPIPIVLIECICAFIMEWFIAGPLSMKIAFSKANPEKDNPVILETLIVCATASIMCPLMSFIATILYHLIPDLMYHTCSIGTAFANMIPEFLQTFVQNFPFAILSQLFFIQPFVRKVFALIFERKEVDNKKVQYIDASNDDTEDTSIGELNL